MPRKTSALPLKPPIDPMLAKLAEALPAGDYLYEPKWDGFRALGLRSRWRCAGSLRRTLRRCAGTQ